MVVDPGSDGVVRTGVWSGAAAALNVVPAVPSCLVSAVSWRSCLKSRRPVRRWLLGRCFPCWRTVAAVAFLAELMEMSMVAAVVTTLSLLLAVSCLASCYSALAPQTHIDQTTLRQSVVVACALRPAAIVSVTVRACLAHPQEAERL